MAKLVQFAVDAPVTPRRVLVCEAEHEAPQLCRRRRAPRSGWALGPVPGDESAVPPNNGGGSDDENTSASR